VLPQQATAQHSSGAAHIEEAKSDTVPPVPNSSGAGGQTALTSSPPGHVSAEIAGSKNEAEEEPPAIDSTTFEPHHLWDLAYDSLKSEKTELLKAYEKILSHKLTKPDENSEAIAEQDAPDDQENSIAQNNPKLRRSQMARAVQIGLKRTEKEAKIKEELDPVMTFVLSTKAVLDSALQAVPQAAVTWSGCCFVLEILLNPVKQTSANRDGLVYVLTRMKWYMALSNILLIFFIY